MNNKFVVNLLAIMQLVWIYSSIEMALLTIQMASLEVVFLLYEIMFCDLCILSLHNKNNLFFVHHDN